MIRRPIGREMARTAVVVGTATAVSGGVRRRQEQKYMGQQEQAEMAAQAQAAPQAPAEPVAAAPAAAGLTSEDLDTLKELAALKDQGVLSEAEFEAQKAKILGS
jgi:Short C-terminal domain